MRSKNLIWVVLLLVVITWLAISVLADDPAGPEGLATLNTSRRITGAARSVQAQAGNVSELSINTTTITQGWQGYYGNISGTIVLDDALNNSMYTWDLADPEGEVYASRNNSINWTSGNVICANITHVESEESALDFNLGIGQDVDGINETFGETTHPAFNVSSTGFLADQCDFTVSTYVDDAPDASRNFNETLLYSMSDSSLIYVALIVQGGADGFKSGNENYDFQMLVAEDGHQGDSTATNYYFYVEIS